MLPGTGSGAEQGPGWHGGASPREAQSIMFSQVFHKQALIPVPLHPPSFSWCWQRWRDQKPSGTPGVMESGRGAGRSVGFSPYKPAETTQQQRGWAPTALPSAPLLVGQLHKSPQGLPLGQACARWFFLQLLPTTLSPHKNGLGGGKMLQALCWPANALPSSSP